MWGFVSHFNTFSPIQDDCHLPNDIIMYESVCTLIQIALEFIAKCPISNKLTLFKAMAWHQPDNKCYIDQWWVSVFTCTYKSLILNELIYAQWNAVSSYA